jgi:hypothetical protein
VALPNQYGDARAEHDHANQRPEGIGEESIHVYPRLQRAFHHEDENDAPQLARRAAQYLKKHALSKE